MDVITPREVSDLLFSFDGSDSSFFFGRVGRVDGVVFVGGGEKTVLAVSGISGVSGVLGDGVGVSGDRVGVLGDRVL